MKKQVRSLGIVIPILLLCALLTGCAGDAVSYVGGSAQTSAKLPQSTTDAVVMVPEVTTSSVALESPAPQPVTTTPDDAVPPKAQVTTQPATTQALPVFPPEEKIPFEIGPEGLDPEHWSDTSLILMMTTAQSLQLYDYSAEDFPEIACVEAKTLRYSMNRKILEADLENLRYGQPITDYQMEELKNCHQFVTVVLANPGMDEVEKAIRLLEQREDVLSVEPNAIQYAD